MKLPNISMSIDDAHKFVVVVLQCSSRLISYLMDAKTAKETNTKHRFRTNIERGNRERKKNTLCVTNANDSSKLLRRFI